MTSTLVNETAGDFADSYQHHRISSGGVTLHVVEAGPPDGTPVVLLHGFPTSWRLWREQIPALSAAGHRVFAIDQRGFGDSDKPQRVEDYRATRLMGDVVTVMNSLGVKRAHLVAHDWGAFVGWMLASLMPHRVDHFVVMSVGHPAVLARPTVEQRERSWYMLLYQFEEAEAILKRDNWRLLRDLYDGERDAAQFLADLRRPGALRAGLNWYRANRHPRLELEKLPKLPPVQAPTLGIWGAGDKALAEEGMQLSGAHVAGPWRYVRVEDAGHYIPVDAPEVVSDLILSHLGSHAATEPVPVRRRRY